MLTGKPQVGDLESDYDNLNDLIVTKLLAGAATAVGYTDNARQPMPTSVTDSQKTPPSYPAIQPGKKVRS